MCQLSGQQVSLSGAIPLSCPPVWVCLRHRDYSRSSCQQRASFRLSLLHSMTSAEPSHLQQQTHTHKHLPRRIQTTADCHPKLLPGFSWSLDWTWIQIILLFESWDDYKKLLLQLFTPPPPISLSLCLLSHLLYFSSLCSPKYLQVEESVLETRSGC